MSPYVFSTNPLSVFLYYASKDKSADYWLCKRLSEDGFYPRLDEECLLLDQDSYLEIEKALHTSDTLLLSFYHVCIPIGIHPDGYANRR